MSNRLIGYQSGQGFLYARIHEAANLVPLKNLGISTQCGFASTEEGNILTEQDEWNKLQLIKSITDKVWS